MTSNLEFVIETRTKSKVLFLLFGRSAILSRNGFFKTRDNLERGRDSTSPPGGNKADGLPRRLVEPRDTALLIFAMVALHADVDFKKTREGTAPYEKRPGAGN